MEYFRGLKLTSKDYCNCKNCRTITSLIEEWGYWDVCCSCGNPLEDGFHYYNHYDGEDHEEDIW